MKDMFNFVMACAIVFACGWAAGIRHESDAHAEQERVMQNRINVLNDIVKQRTKQIEDKTNAKIEALKSTPDTTGCASTRAPAAVLHLVQ